MSGLVRGFSTVAAMAMMIGASSAWAQTDERAVYASVLDRKGTPVTTLTASDFIVREDGIAREVVRVSRADAPSQIAVLVDTSQAIRPHLLELRKGLRAFFQEMQGQHEIALYEFGERPTLLVDYTRDLNRLDTAVGRLFPRTGSGAYVLDAIVEASRGLRKREGARPAIVVITAEGPEFSERYHKAVLDELRESHATLHSLVLTRRRGSFLDDATRERELTLANGARDTGGRREYLLTSMALDEELRQLAAELNNQYEIVYSRPSALITPETVAVSLKREGFTVRAPKAAPRLRSSS
jgi:Ca-activated chloride channel family protein